MKRTIRNVLFAVAAAVAAVAFLPVHAADAVPSRKEVSRAIADGRLGEAQTMLDQVMKARPNSYEAHFLEAELLVRQGRADAAEQELATAERMAPGLPNVDPASVRILRQRIADASGRSRAGAAGGPVAQYAPAAPASEESHFPWGIVLIFLGAGLVLWLVMRSRAQAVPVLGAPGAAGPVYGGSPYGAPMMGGGGLGSGIVGGLATGAAIGAGMVAGEAIAGELMGGSRSRDLGSMGDDRPRIADDSGSGFGISGSDWDSGGDWS